MYHTNCILKYSKESFFLRRKLSKINLNDFMFLINRFRVSNFIMSEMAVIIQMVVWGLYINSVIMQKCVPSAVFYKYCIRTLFVHTGIWYKWIASSFTVFFIFDFPCLWGATCTCSGWPQTSVPFCLYLPSVGFMLAYSVIFLFF